MEKIQTQTAILNAKESLATLKQDLYSIYRHPIVSIQANDPSEVKLNGWTGWIVQTFESLLTSMFKVIHSEHHFSELGMITLLILDEDPQLLKKHCIHIESSHPCGRCVDLDVFTLDRNLSRNELGLEERQCFVCDQIARVCIRKQTHSRVDVNQAFQKLVMQSFSSKVEIIRFALLSECMLPTKFGLVTPLSSGIHKDMDIHTFIQSIDAIVPYFSEVDQISLSQSTQEIFQELRQLGIKIEDAMFKATSGINTHKGSIFIFLMFLMAQRLAQPFQEALKDLAQPLLQDFEKINSQHPLTEGEKQYLNYHTLGVKGWILSAGEPLLSQVLSYYQSKLDSYHHQVNTLLLIMSQCEDSTIIKKGGLDGLKDFQLQALRAFEHPELWDEFESYCMHHQTSAGGSADIFALILYLTYSQERNHT
jgi:holo-ACP synthase/triphosphoribosyl-dephospho-CoA synthase